MGGGGSGSSLGAGNLGSGAGSATGGRAGASATSGRLSTSNFLSTSYVYPYVTGLYTDSARTTGTSGSNTTVGTQGASNSPKKAASFFTTATYGQPLYNVTSTTGGTATIRGGTGGRAGGTATTTGSNDFGPAISGTRYPHVAAVVKFATTAKSSDELTSDIKSLLERSSSVTAKNTVRVRVEDRIVTLSGTVADDDERRHVEALIRLSPGVRDVRNELEVK